MPPTLTYMKFSQITGPTKTHHNMARADCALWFWLDWQSYQKLKEQMWQKHAIRQFSEVKMPDLRRFRFSKKSRMNLLMTFEHNLIRAHISIPIFLHQQFCDLTYRWCFTGFKHKWKKILVYNALNEFSWLWRFDWLAWLLKLTYYYHPSWLMIDVDHRNFFWIWGSSRISCKFDLLKMVFILIGSQEQTWKHKHKLEKEFFKGMLFADLHLTCRIRRRCWIK